MINLDEHANFTEVLDKATDQNEKVFVVMEGGKEYYGRAKRMNEHYFSIREISGKEYYDAIIRIEKVVAIEVRARG